jgi:hypothetical protein
MAKSPGRPTAADRASLGENRTASDRAFAITSRWASRVIRCGAGPWRCFGRQEAGRCQVDKAGSNHAGDTEQSSGARTFSLPPTRLEVFRSRWRGILGRQGVYAQSVRKNRLVAKKHLVTHCF